MTRLGEGCREGSEQEKGRTSQETRVELKGHKGVNSGLAVAAPLCYKLDTDSLARAQGFRTQGYCLVCLGWVDFYSGFQLRNELKLECEVYKTGQDAKIGKTQIGRRREDLG